MPVPPFSCTDSCVELDEFHGVVPTFAGEFDLLDAAVDLIGLAGNPAALLKGTRMMLIC